MPFQVIAGTARGRRLKSPPDGVRPTAAILRRSLFDIIGPDVIEARVLDLYAGAGSLGVEALSRGAAGADFVDRDRRCVAVIRANLGLLGDTEGAASSRVDCAPVESWLRRNRRRLSGYDLLILDPPYGEPGLEKVLSQLARPGTLKPDALVVVEERADRELDTPEGMRIVRRVEHGDSALTMMRPAP
ncbi:MAG TPA: 16S rRNA (guanine(966)-N(2))-methyltransferase RsmD [Candidatus Solibacter sp.]|jgi:16S rRNA (guanine966-N2)-methyltransferase|nr:16S rRNA (guanine(966)-N(2))-methyltransferase RsmD [Candidatus Solibacter sp.]